MRGGSVPGAVWAYQRVLEVTAALLEEPSGDPPDAVLVPVLMDCLGSSGGFFIDIRPQDGAAEIRALSPDWSRSALGEVLDVGYQHPLFEHYYTTGMPEVLDAQELLGAPAWRRNEIYWRSKELLGAWQHVNIPLEAGPQRMRSYSFGRPGEAYTAEEVEFGARIRPLLVALHRQRREFAHWAERVDPAPLLADHGLTPREATVLRLITEALPAKSIARRLNISPRTVHKHTENLYRKLGTLDRISTVLRARDLGLTPSPSAEKPSTSAAELVVTFPPR
ncbi:response regulator transcription factor [Nocardia sp. NPDC004722]